MSRNIALTIIATILVLPLVNVAEAQIKIGDMEITEAIAKEYFLDCYVNPDTVRVYRKSSSYGNEPRFYDDLGNRYFNRETIKKKYLRGLAKQRTKHEWRRGLEGIYLKTRTPSADDFAEWFRRKK